MSPKRRRPSGRPIDRSVAAPLRGRRRVMRRTAEHRLRVKNRSTQVDAGGAPDRRLECAFARRFCARRIFARSFRSSRRERAASFCVARRGRLACTFSTRPSLIGTRKPTDWSGKFQDIFVKNHAKSGTYGPKAPQQGCLFGQPCRLLRRRLGNQGRPGLRNGHRTGIRRPFRHRFGRRLGHGLGNGRRAGDGFCSGHRLRDTRSGPLNRPLDEKGGPADP
jgi:hypothetical protein